MTKEPIVTIKLLGIIAKKKVKESTFYGYPVCMIMRGFDIGYIGWVKPETLSITFDVAIFRIKLFRIVVIM